MLFLTKEQYQMKLCHIFLYQLRRRRKMCTSIRHAYFLFYVYSPISLKWLNQSGWFFLYLVEHMLRLVLLKNFVDSVIVNYFFFFFKKTFIFAPIIYFIYVRRFLRNGLTNQDNFFCNLRGMFPRWSSYKTFLHLFFVNYIFCKNPIFMYVRLSRIGLKYRNGTFRIL